MSLAAEITESYARYFRAFQTLDPDEVAPFFDVPCALVTAGNVAVATTRAEVASLFDGMMARLRRLGYGSTDLGASRVQALGTGLAQLTVSATRRRSDGTELERIGATYVFRRAEGWRIAVIVVHDPRIPDLDPPATGP